MGTLTLNLTSESQFEPLAAGTYDATLKELRVEVAKDGQNYNLVWDFVVQGEKGTKNVRTWTSLKATAEWKARKYLAAFGVDDSPDKPLMISYDDDSGIVYDPGIEDRPCRVVVSPRLYNDRMVDSIEEVLPAEKTAATTKKRQAVLV